MIARLPPTYLLPLVLALSACGGSSDDPPPVMSGGSSVPPGAGEGPDAGVDEDADAGSDTGPESGPEEEPQQDANPFQTPDPSGATVLERRGYRDATEQADRLISAGYLDAYRAVAKRLPLLAEGIALGIEPVSVPCPDGGTAALSRPLAGADGEGNVLLFAFDACATPDLTLRGRLEQTRARIDARFNSERELASRFDGLVIDLEDGTRLQLDGTFKDGETETFLPICGTMPAVTLAHEVRLDTVSIDSPADGVTRLQDVTYIGQDENVFEDRETCDRERRVSFAGSATATLASEPGGEVLVELDKNGVLLRDDDDAPPTGGQATLTATASDGSSLSVTANDDATGLAQFDLRAGDAVVSFVDTYAFEP